MAEFGLAINRKFKSATGEDREEVCFVDCAAFGRTGEMWGSTTFGIQPDMITCAKALSSGYLPIGAVLVSAIISLAAAMILASRAARPSSAAFMASILSMGTTIAP